MSTLSPPSPPAPPPRRRDLALGAALLLGFLLGVVYLHYIAFVGPLFGADPESPDCVHIEATITSGSHTRRTVGQSYDLSYRYEVGGTEYTGHERVDVNRYSGAAVGGKLGICYMKGNPGQSAVLRNDAHEDLALLLVLVDALTIAGGVRNLRKARRAKAAAA